MKRLAYVLLPLNVLVDTLLLFAEQLSWLPLTRAFLLLLLLVYVFASYRNHLKYYPAIVVFIVYCSLQLFFVSDFQKSLVMTLKVCIPIASFAIGFRVFNTPKELRKLSVSVLWVYLILAANFLLSQLFQLGKPVYSEQSDFRVGNLDDGWNVFTYSVLLAPLVLSAVGHSKWLRWATYTGAIGNALLVVLSIKRIAILGLITGNAIRTIFVPKTLRWVRSFLVFASIALVGVYMIKDTLLERIELRSNRFESGALEKEGRYLETSYVWEEVWSFDQPGKSLFGLEGFNSVGNYANGMFGERQVHVDYNLIVNTIGLVGLGLYLLIFWHMYRIMRGILRMKMARSARNTVLISCFWMLLLNQFITSTAGQMYHISFRLMVFVFLGAIMGNLLNDARSQNDPKLARIE